MLSVRPRNWIKLEKQRMENWGELRLWSVERDGLSNVGMDALFMDLLLKVGYVRSLSTFARAIPMFRFRSICMLC